MTHGWRTAWITGASSGIGRELALLLAKEGVRVVVSARSAEKLAELEALDPRIVAVPLDVTDRGAVAEAVRRIEGEIGPIDLAVLNAGVWYPMAARAFDAAKAEQSMAVNYSGITNVLEPLIPVLTGRGRGQIALVGSVAGYRGLPQASAYAPSKAAVIALAEVLRLELAPLGIKVQLVNPGFVETPMTAVNPFEMPFLMPAEEAARRIRAGLVQSRFEIVFPWQLARMLKVLRVLPYGLYFRVATRFLPRH